MNMCGAAVAAWALVMHVQPQAPALHTEITIADSCYLDAALCETAAIAANDAFYRVNHPESTAHCEAELPSAHQ